MDISIIMPCYNGQNYIEETLKSIYQQCTDLLDIEVLLLDDASSDNTLDVLREYTSVHRHPNLKWEIISNSVNRGQGILRNEGIKRAQGRYLFFMDSDDIIEKDMMVGIFTSLKKYSEEPEVVQFEWAFFDDVTHKINYSQPTNEKNGTLFLGEKCERVLKQAIYYPVNRLYKKEFLLIHDICFGEGYIYEDFEFFVRMATKVESLLILKAIYYYVRLHNNSTTGANRKTSKHFNDFQTAVSQTMSSVQTRDKESLYHVLHYFLSKSVGYAPRFPEELCDEAVLGVMKMIKEREGRFIIPNDAPELDKKLFNVILKDSEDIEKVKKLFKMKHRKELPIRLLKKIKREIKSEIVWIYQ